MTANSKLNSQVFACQKLVCPEYLNHRNDQGAIGLWLVRTLAGDVTFKCSGLLGV